MTEFPAYFAELPAGIRLHYVDTCAGGDGDDVPVIVLHGLVGTPQSELPNVIEWLQPNYRVVAPTRRGYGLSEPKPRQFPVNFYHLDADDVIALMNALGIRHAHIMGYSDGGEVALIAAGKYPERFKSVAVWGAVGYYGPAMRPVAQNVYPGTWMTEEEKALHSISDPAYFTLQWVQAVRYIIDSGGDLSVSLIRNCRAPVLLMLGEEDRLNPVDYARKLAENAPDGQVVLFPCGHAVHQEVEDQFKQVVGAFLDSVKD